MNRKIIAGILIVLGIVLAGLIVDSAKLTTARNQRDDFSNTDLTLVTNYLDETGTFFGKLANGGQPGDDILNELAHIDEVTQLLKHSGVFTMYDETPGFDKAGFSYSDALNELQLAIYNLDNKMSQYHYVLSNEDLKHIKNLAQAVFELKEQTASIKDAAWDTGGNGQAALAAYKEKADQVQKTSQVIVNSLLKE